MAFQRTHDESHFKQKKLFVYGKKNNDFNERGGMSKLKKKWKIEVWLKGRLHRSKLRMIGKIASKPPETNWIAPKIETSFEIVGRINHELALGSEW